MAGKGSVAEEIRTGLTPQRGRPDLQVVATTPRVDILDTRENGKTIRLQIRDFGAVLALVAAIVAAVITWKHGATVRAAVWLGAGTFAYCFAVYAPRAMLPIWRGWMKFAHILGMVMTTLILSLTWFLMMVPTAFLVRLFGKSPIDMRFRLQKESYWEDRDPRNDNFKLLERQF
jgi:Saxitoxin biosynthesis operon protein SxtJ